jgi:hypothetical protein
MEENNLKIKIAQGDFSFELEGPAEKVIEQFTDLKENGLGKLASPQKTSVIPSGPPARHQHPDGIKEDPPLNSSTSSQQKASPNGTRYISLRDLLLKQLPKSEPEWLLVYAFYSSNYAQNEFTRDDILLKYEETNRKTDNRMANLSNNIKAVVGKDWLRSLNDKDMLVTDEGITTAKEILSRTSSSKPKKVAAKKKKNGNDN